MTYQIIVGNIGTVYQGPSAKEANKHFDEYVEQSKSNTGRAGGEDVFMFLDDEVVKMFEGNLKH